MTSMVFPSFFIGDSDAIVRQSYAVCCPVTTKSKIRSSNLASPLTLILFNARVSGIVRRELRFSNFALLVAALASATPGGEHTT